MKVKRNRPQRRGLTLLGLGLKEKSEAILTWKKQCIKSADSHRFAVSAGRGGWPTTTLEEADAGGRTGDAGFMKLNF